MTLPTGWPPLRRRLARFRKETAMTPASLPLQLTEPEPPAAPPEPEKTVQCGWCQAIGPSSLIPEVPTRGPRCADHDACTSRWVAGRPVSLLPHEAEPLEPLPVLPPAQEEALAAFEAAHDEENTAEAGEDLSEDGESGPAAAEDATPDEGDAE